ncbi:MAG: hypothetical protein IJU40_03980 [Desulfovibrionaceae bacterium]|nr:hypothetical protein [Desulfovibrionaceae bacterium]
MQKIDKKLLREAFEYLGEMLDQNGMQGKICIYGGSALIFATDLRDSSFDVDYRIIEVNGNHTINSSLKNKFTLLVFDVAEKMGFDLDWMNRSVEIFISQNENYSYSESFANKALTVLTPSLECLLAMRDTCDVEDLKNLIKKLGLQTTDQVLEIIRFFYPIRKLKLDAISKIEEILG